MADTILLTGLGGVAGAVMASQSDDMDKLTFQDIVNAVDEVTTEPSEHPISAVAPPQTQDKMSDVIVLVIFAVIFVLIILFFVMVYKMFPDYKALHVLFTMIFGFFWLIPAMLYYLFVKKGYHMTGIRIAKRL